MEKLNISQICILCTKSIADGRISDFFKDRGVVVTFTGKGIGYYYHSNGGIILAQREKPEGKTKINPWKTTRRKFPREMMVSRDENEWHKRTVICKTKAIQSFIAVKLPWEIGDDYMEYIGWKYAKEI
jgi:hypothetical protein